MEEGSEKSPSRSQTDFADKVNRKMHSNFIFTTQRKITEDYEELENLSQNSAEKEEVIKPKKSKMCKNSLGFIPKHLRDAKKLAPAPDSDEINEFVDNIVNSRKASKADEDDTIEKDKEQENFGELIRDISSDFK